MKKFVICLGLILVLVFAVIVFTPVLFPSEPEKAPAPATETKEAETLPTLETTTEAQEIPTPPSTQETKEEAYSKTPLMKGIDVSKWQGKPNWKKIAESGVEFAMIRIGFHGTGGSIGEDSSADYNLKKAEENGILTGVYFYSLAKNEQEAKEEAEWILQKIETYNVSLPIVLDYEMKDNDTALTAAARTDIAVSFFRTVKDAGYEGMLYVPAEELEDARLWEKERILAEAPVWVADYKVPDPEKALHPDGETPYAMWQYSNTGRVAGINGNVDLNFAYFAPSRQDTKTP